MTTPTHTVATPKTFEEKMMDRIRDSIGDLMTQEDLKRIVERGVEKALFERREVADRGWGGGSTIEESLVDRAVKTYLNQRMIAAVNQWIANNPDKLQSAVDNAIKLGAGGCLIDVLDSRFKGIFANAVEQMRNNGTLPRLT